MAMIDAIDNGTCFGHVLTRGHNKGKMSPWKVYARQACTIAHGRAPPGYVVRHLCVNDSMADRRGEGSFVCVNPAHIEWNTRKQNVGDARHNMRGKTLTPEHKANISAGRTGMIFSPEHRAKLSLAARNRKK